MTQFKENNHTQEDLKISKKSFTPKRSSFSPWKQDSLLSQTPHLDEQETEHKPHTLQTQTEHNKIHKLNTNNRQTEHNQNTQLNTNYLQSVHKPSKNITQTKHKSEHRARFIELVGVQKSLMIAIYENCKKNGARITDSLTLEDLSKYSQVNISSIKTSACRLESKSFIIRIQFKNGRGGWTIYEIPEPIYQEVYQFEISGKLNTNQTQIEHKSNTELNTQENHYSSSNFITTIGEGWDEIDYSSLQEIHFDMDCLIQLKKCNIPPEVVQESIHRYAFTRNKIMNEKTRNEEYPLKMIMGVLRKGNTWSKDKDYMSPQEQKIRRALEEIKEQKIRTEQAAKELFDLRFNDWHSKLNEDEIQKITTERIPSEIIVKLRSHFKETIWPSIKKAWS